MQHDGDAAPHADADAPPPNVTPIGAARVRKRKRVEPTNLEIDAARRFVATFGAGLRYAHGIGWLRDTGTHWTADTRGVARELGKRFVRALRDEAAAVDDLALWSLCQSLGRARGITSLLESACSDERVRVSADDLDTHAHLLAARNGIVDLRDGTLLPYDPTLLLTRCTRAEYVPGARHAGFDRLLDHLTPDAEVRAYLQRAVGYSLAATASEDVIFLLVGAPRCGKSTLLRALTEALGEHFASASMRSFCASKNGSAGAASPDMFRLIGRRIVAASEIHPGLAFDSGRLKSIAGGERLPVRGLYAAEIEVGTTWTLWLVANDGDLPRMRSEDDALWERVRRIPVGATLPEAARDRKLRESFSSPEARAAVLAWGVEGAVACHRDGLGAPPTAVSDATRELRATMDTIAPFITTLLRFEHDAVALKRSVRDAYVAWAEGNGEQPASPKRFKAGLEAAGQREGVSVGDTTKRDGGKVHPAWRHVRLATDAERNAREQAAQEPTEKEADSGACRDVETCRDQIHQNSATRADREVRENSPLHPSTSLHDDRDAEEWGAP